MLLSCSFDNFLSFKEEGYFELAAPKNRVRNRYPDNYVKLRSGDLVLKDAVIAGENAGGKSNFITVFKFLRSLFVQNDVRPRSYSNLIFSGNLTALNERSDSVDTRLTVQNFSVEIAIDSYTYRYALSLAAGGIVTESLERRAGSSRPYELVFSISPTEMVVSCDECPVSDDCVVQQDGATQCRRFTVAQGPALELPGPLAASVNQLGSSSLGSLYVQTLATLGEPSCVALTNWFTSELVIALREGGMFSMDGLVQDGIEAILKDQRYFEIFRLVDSSINQINVDMNNPFRDTIIIRRTADGSLYGRALRDDSTGVAQFAQWALAIYLVVYQNKTVFADEIDSAINPVLSDRVLAFINGHDHQGQFIYTTHNVLALTLRTFMKEQIYFVSKDIETLESSLYSLADFKDVRYDVKGEVYDFYLSGVLGGTVNG